MRLFLLALSCLYAGVSAGRGGSAIGVSVPSSTCSGTIRSDSGEKITVQLTTIEKEPTMYVLFGGERFGDQAYSRRLPSFSVLGHDRIQTAWLDGPTSYRLRLSYAGKEVPTELRVRERGDEDVFRGTLLCR